MEITENYIPPGESPQLFLTEQAQSYLKKAGQWATFLSIVGFIMTAFLVLAALFAGSMFAMMAKLNPMMPLPPSFGILITIFYGFFAVLTFFIALYLYQFGDRIKKGIMYGSVDQTTSALSKLKSFFKLWGIITIVTIVLYALIIVIAIVVGAGAASTLGR